MQIIKGFNEKTFYEIAKKCGSKQLLSDVRYMRIPLFRKQEIYAERLDDIAIAMGVYSKHNTLRIVGIGVADDKKNKGYGRYMLQMVIEQARQRGIEQITTRTQSGCDFYMKYAGARIVGMADEDYLLEIDV